MKKTWVGKEMAMELFKAFGWVLSQFQSLELRKSLALLLYEV
jgi:hypothetical protein